VECLQIILAEHAGFCYGVKRAVDLALKTLTEQGPSYTLGPLVHNREVTDFLSGKGLEVEEDVNQIDCGKVILRSHGVAPDILERLQSKGLEVVDATCPMVSKVQELARKMAVEGYQVVIFGNMQHPEVTGLKGWAGDNAIVAGTPEEIAALDGFKRIAAVSQTTLSETLFQRMAAELVGHADEIRIFHTICQASSRRQRAASQLAEKVDVMLVVGDRSSANTGSLVRICEAKGVPTHLVETAREINPEWFHSGCKVGITAGASTPDWLIKEVIDWMADMETNAVKDEQTVSASSLPETEAQNDEKEEKKEISFAELEAEMAETMKAVERGTILKGTVIQVGNDEVMVDVGGKSEGIIPLRELSLHDVEQADDVVQVGDEVTVMVLRWEEDGTILVSKRRVDQEMALDNLQKCFESETAIKGTVLKTVKGGLLVDVGLPGFLPASQVDSGFNRDLESYVGKELLLDIIEFNRGKRRGSQVILSRRKQADLEKKVLKQQFWDNISVGQKLVGKVKRLTDYGAFVDIGGFEGLLHISEIDHIRIAKPSDVLSEGQEIEVSVIGLDAETERVSLSRKRILPSPWETIGDRLSEGMIVSGKVVRTAPFGAFVELEPGIDGLVHISQLSNHKVARTEDAVKIGETVNVKIIGLNAQERRIALSIKEAEAGIDDSYVADYLENQDKSQT
jgi:4-hydroxy-3-methylbut-2-enyl diphosphate reductase